jgi:hypothetical protein
VTVEIKVTAGPGQQTYVQYEEKVGDTWLPGKRGPIPLAQGEVHSFWVHSTQRIVVSEDGSL